MKPPCRRPRDTPCWSRMRPGYPEAHLCQRDGAAGGVAQAVVHRMKSEEAIIARGPPSGERGARRWEPVPCSRPPAEAAIALAMDVVAVLGGLDVEGWLCQGLQVNSLPGTQGLQDGIEPLPRPLQQAAESINGDPVR